MEWVATGRNKQAPVYEGYCFINKGSCKRKINDYWKCKTCPVRVTASRHDRSFVSISGDDDHEPHDNTLIKQKMKTSVKRIAESKPNLR